MSKWIAEILALVVSMGAITPLYGIGVSDHRMGIEIVTEVEESYRRGKYDDFLIQFDEQYQRAGKVGALKGVYENAKKGLPSKMLEESISAYKDEVKQMRSSLAQLHKDFQKRLVEAVAEDSDSDIAKKVDSVVYFSMDPKSKELLYELDSYRYQITGNLEASLIDKIAHLQREYYLKSLLLTVANLKSKSGLQELQRKKIALELRKFERLEDLTKAAKDPVWIEKIAKAKEAYRQSLAYQIDYDTLKGLVIGELEASTETEKKVKAVMAEYLNKKSSHISTFSGK